jgi:hypothetical protein
LRPVIRLFDVLFTICSDLLLCDWVEDLNRGPVFFVSRVRALAKRRSDDPRAATPITPQAGWLPASR